MEKCKCGAELQKGVKFCPECGEAVEQKSLIDQIKGVVTDGLKTVQEKVAALESKVTAIEKTPMQAKNVSFNFKEKKFLGYNMDHQLIKMRNAAEKSPRDFQFFKDPENCENYSKYILSIYKAKKHQDLAAMQFITDFQKTISVSEGTTTEGGYLVPDEMASDILKLGRNVGFALNECTVMPMGSDVMYVPTEGTNVTVAWTTEKTAATQTSPVFDRQTLTAKKLDALTQVTNELLEDASYDVVGLITDQFIEAILLELDNQVLNGTGNPVSGVLTAAAGKSVVLSGAAFSTITAAKLSEAIYSVDQSYHAGAKFIVGQIGLHHLRGLVDSNGAPVWAPVAAAQPGTVYGFPYFQSSKITNTTAGSTGFVVFGNFKKFLVGRRKGGIVLDVDPYGLFKEYATQFRVITRWGLSHGIANAFCRVITGA